MNCHLPIFILLLNLFSPNAYSAINKWVDDSGRIHYSDQAPPENTESTVLVSDVAASDVVASTSNPSATKTLAERAADFKKSRKAKAEAEQAAAKSQEEADAKQKYCLAVRNSLKALEEGSRVASYDADGEVVYLDDSARQKQIQEAHEAIATKCK